MREANSFYFFFIGSMDFTLYFFEFPSSLPGLEADLFDGFLWMTRFGVDVDNAVVLLPNFEAN